MRFLLALSVGLLAASLLGLAAVLHQHQVQTFGAVDGLPDPALDPRPASVRAINVDLTQYDDAQLERALDQLRGFAWLRQTLAWRDLEPAPGQYDWQASDRLVSAATERGYQLIAVVTGPPPESVPLIEGYQALITRFAARYQNQIDVYQIWDEPNLYSGWGKEPSAAEYAALLQAAYTAIHAADPTATVIAAALAPTLETGPDNVSDLLFLQQLYDLGAQAYFDAAAGKPYGFYTGPDDRQVGPTILNFSRFTLLRQVMERNGDGHKLLWGANFGWNTRPDSIWGLATPEQQAAFTLRAYERAEQEWPWAGPLALESYQPNAPRDDPRWGFALADPDQHFTLLGQSLRSNPQSPALPGNYAAAAPHPAAEYVGAWEFSDLGADIPQAYTGAQLRITFQGSDFGLRVRRGDYRAYLHITVDGRPANRLPLDEQGRSYLVLTSPSLKPEVQRIPIASDLDPDQIHIVVIEPERGWDQWAVAGFAVGRRLPAGNVSLAVGGLLTLALLSLGGLLRFGRSLNWSRVNAALHAAWCRLSDNTQVVITSLIGVVLYLSAWIMWDTQIVTFTRRFGDTLPILVTALTAGLFYFSPSFVVALLALAALFVLFYLRLDIALAFVALFIPFYLFPRMLWSRGASLLEFSLWLAFAAWLLRNFRPTLVRVRGAVSNQPLSASRQRPTAIWSPSTLDFGVLALVVVALASLFTAARQDVAVYEFRTVILGSALFYFLLRVVPLDGRAVWRLVDFFILGATAVALIGLYQYATGTDLIVTEEGVARIRSVYGSPNNLGLYLGRALPVAIAVVLLGRRTSSALPSSGRHRRSVEARSTLYLLAIVIMGAALLLSFSRGALILGLPAALAVIVIGWQGRRGALIVGVAVLLAVIAVPLIAQVPRFASLLNLQSGTGFFRLNLWLSAWRMFLDHPWLGVGLDNFLYAYRSFYILPQAWQEPNLSHPHNIALDFLTRLGLLGFACGAWLLVGFWRQSLITNYPLRLTQIESRALLIGLMALMADMVAHGLVDHSFFLVDLAFVFMLALALVQRLPAEPV